MTDVEHTRTLTPEGALKLLNAAIAEATAWGCPYRKLNLTSS